VAKAIYDCAFHTSQQPVLLSLEMHCTAKQQRILANLMVEHLGDLLMSYDELSRLGESKSLSPLNLQRRVMAKGKVKPPKEKISPKTPKRTSRIRLVLGRTTLMESRKSSQRTSSKKSPKSSVDASAASARKCSTAGRRADRTLHAIRLRSASWLNASRQTGSTTNRKTAYFAISSGTDEFYAGCLALRSVPVQLFMVEAPQPWVLPITSVNEDRLLVLLGLRSAQRNQIEGLVGLQTGRPTSGTGGGIGPADELNAVARFASDPPQEVGHVQRRTAKWLLRPYPLGLRFSGSNMSPVPCWLAGAQGVCLNMSNNDNAVQLHFTLFHGSGGYVLKPPLMRSVKSPPACRASDTQTCASAEAEGSFNSKSGAAGGCSQFRLESSASSRDEDAPPTSRDEESLDDRSAEDDDYWPLPCDTLDRTTVEIISLHNLPKRSEQRPRLDGSLWQCHKYAPELTGPMVGPDNLEPSRPLLSVHVHAIGGFCAVTNTLPFRRYLPPWHITISPQINGMNATFHQKVHCIASESHSTFLRLGVVDSTSRHEVAYEVAVLGRLRRGFRVLQLRSSYGTRIELAYLFVKISFARQKNIWPTARQLRGQLREEQPEVRRVSASSASYVDRLSYTTALGGGRQPSARALGRV